MYDNEELNAILKHKLQSFGIFPTLKGFNVTIEAVKIMKQNPYHMPMNYVFKELNKKYPDSNYYRFERAVRSAIISANKKGKLSKYTCYEFLSLLANDMI